MSIVHATDFSAESGGALEAAGALTAIYGELWIVHALDVLDPALQGSDFASARAKGERKLRDTRDRFERAWGLKARTMLLHGTPAQAIADFAEARRAQLIVVGSRGHGATPMFKLGGTSERLGVTARCSLLVVRDGSPLVAWARGQRRLRVLLGVDAGSSWEQALDWVRRVRLAGACDLTVGQVYYGTEERRRYGLPPLGAIDEIDQEVEGLLTRDMKARLRALDGHNNGNVSFRPIRGFGRIGDHLLQFAHDEQTDLIVLGTHHRKGVARLASVASVALHYGHAAVLLVPQARELGAHVSPPRRVLVATDLSPFANRAVSHACALLEGREGQVVVLHVAPDPDRRARELATVQKELAHLVTEGSAATARMEIVRGTDPARAICEAAERFGADIVCLASHGRRGLTRALLGSVAEEVVRKSRRPVLVVRSPPD